MIPHYTFYVAMTHAALLGQELNTSTKTFLNVRHVVLLVPFAVALNVLESVTRTMIANLKELHRLLTVIVGKSVNAKHSFKALKLQGLNY